MTDEELLRKRAEHWRFYHRTGPTSASHDVTLFLDRLEQLERDLANVQQVAAHVEDERDRLRKALAAKHSECPDCADYAARSGRFAEQADRLQRERDEHKAKREEYAAEARSLRERLKDAYAEVEVLRGVDCCANEDGRAWENNGKAIADALADLKVEDER